MTANTNFELLARLAFEFRPESVVIADEKYYERLKECLAGTDISVHAGRDALCDLAAKPVDCVVGAIVGIAGLPPVNSAIQAGQKIALANKETLLLLAISSCQCFERQALLLPVDPSIMHFSVFERRIWSRLRRHTYGVWGPFRQMSGNR